jgi:hypothetical protein
MTIELTIDWLKIRARMVFLDLDNKILQGPKSKYLALFKTLTDPELQNKYEIDENFHQFISNYL